MRERLHANAVAAQIPWGQEESMQGVIDLVEMQAIVFDEKTQGASIKRIDIPDELHDAALAARAELVEKGC
jgi:elongation factor G